jgi:LysR family hydrogen peroxide-inducible transcriptional activator
LPVLAVQPPVPPSADIALLQFRGEAPHRRIAMVWRKSSALGPLLQQLSEVFRQMPAKLLRPPEVG